MKIARIAIAFLASVLSGAALAQIETAPPLPLDVPQTMRAMEAVCTGIGQDAREDPRWAAYPLKIELVGRAGQFLQFGVHLEGALLKVVAGGVAMFVLEELDLAAKEGAIVVDLDYVEAAASHSKDVHAAIGISTEHVDDLCGAASRGDLLSITAEDAEGAFLAETFSDHLSIARLENVERERRLREEDEIQGEERQQVAHKKIVSLQLAF